MKATEDVRKYAAEQVFLTAALRTQMDQKSTELAGVLAEISLKALEVRPSSSDFKFDVRLRSLPFCRQR
jgi:hypothetical protein